MTDPIIYPRANRVEVKRAKRLLRRQLSHMGRRARFDHSQYYGERAVEAVKTIQRRHSLKVDGVIGEKTWAVLRAEPRRRPAKVLRWVKWTPQRARVRRIAKRRGLTLTSGDRLWNTLASRGRLSAHWIRFPSQWADDYWHPDAAVMKRFADEVLATRRGNEPAFAQVIVHDAGSGNHVHVAGVRA